ncbi:hypothetical protein GVO57_01475 [Sphingomonas changnyeongensis]|uniref:Tetratricopeptide repeat-containing protein n=1 Tax=Sphingomonas changnyeongensis TaxID=2698679 RepID=A0A7Z2NTU8_9SPHN|nr:hypothetical protein [Sphingomonas changnyeongensis]QHL89738.1 hypothetical protein GVO57_01475 [Sphingomonas changnyeongensis]
MARVMPLRAAALAAAAMLAALAPLRDALADTPRPPVQPAVNPPARPAATASTGPTRAAKAKADQAVAAARGPAKTPAPAQPAPGSGAAPAAGPSATAVPATDAAPMPASDPQMPPPGPARAARLPGFAPVLSDSPRIDGPASWQGKPVDDTLAALAASTPAQRQAARWDYAMSLWSAGRVPEASGVLEVMAQDDPDLVLVDNFDLARGVALTALGRFDEALTLLDRPGLAGNAEACAWRARALAGSGARLLALRQLPCATPALAARRPAERIPFLIPAAEAALVLGDPAAALRILKYTPEADPTSNLIRAKAHQALGQLAEAALLFGRVAQKGNPADQYEARVGEIEVGVKRRTLPPAEALKRLEAMRFSWRGGAAEKHALQLRWQLARQVKDDRAALSAAGTLVRYHDLGPDLPPLMREAQTILTGLLDPGSRVPLDQAAGLYWDYRDLGPGGAEGDLMVARLSERLQSVGLYERAAELLEHQLFERAQDIAQGPLSVRVAKLHILSGHPDRALEVMSATSKTVYPAPMLWDRQRMEAVALQLLGRGQEALAVLQEVPDATGLRAELLWKQRNWQGFLDAAGREAPAARGAMSEVRQAMLLRRAIALGMLGREAELEALRTRYQPAFATLPTARAFDLLTRGVNELDADGFAEAMAAMPAASPGGSLADLLDAAPAAGRGDKAPTKASG